MVDDDWAAYHPDKGAAVVYSPAGCSEPMLPRACSRVQGKSPSSRFPKLPKEFMLNFETLRMEEKSGGIQWSE